MARKLLTLLLAAASCSYCSVAFTSLPVPAVSSGTFTSPARAPATITRLSGADAAARATRAAQTWRMSAEVTGSMYGSKARRESKQQRRRVCIVGGGFGGLYTALRLCKMPWSSGDAPHITLIDKRDKFVFLPLLYDLAAGTASLAEVAPPFRSLLEGTGICFVQGTVTGVDLPARSVTVSGALCDDLDGAAVADAPDESRDIPYDEIVFALGAEPVAPPAADGSHAHAPRHALPFYTVEDAYRLQLALRPLRLRAAAGRGGGGAPPPARVVVVGGSLCGVEIAATLAGLLRGAEISVVTRAPQVLSAAAAANREAGIAKLQRLGTVMRTLTSVDSVAPGAVTVRRRRDSTGAQREDGEWEAPETLPADLVVWTAGSRPNSLAKRTPGLPLDASGRIQVDECLAVEGVPGAYALGDGARVAGAQRLGATAQVAMQQSDYVAWNLWAARDPDARRRPLPFRYTDLGEMVSLGTADGTVSALGARVTLRGPAAALARRAVYALRMPTGPQRAAAAASAVVFGVARVSADALETGLGALEQLLERKK